MDDSSQHEAAARAWLQRACDGAPPGELGRRFELAFAAVWRRARMTLGDVTLTAIAGRVVQSAGERFPALAALTADVDGVHASAIDPTAVAPAALAEGLAFTLAEFLRVLGRLTAEILSPALHAELAKIAPPEADAPAEQPASGGPATAQPGKEVAP